MNQLPFELAFMHKFNIYKTSGLIIDDCDIGSIARVYGVGTKDLRRLETEIDRRIQEAAGEIREQYNSKRLERPYVAAAIGDSITSDRESYQKILACLWKDDPMRSAIDCGISGDTSTDVMRRFYPAILEQDFDRAVVFIGTNDSRENDDGFSLSYVSIEEFERNLSYIIQALQKRGKETVLVTIPYADNERMTSYFPDARWRYDDRRIDLTNETIRKLSKRYGTELCDFAGKLADMGGDYLEPDGLHISIDGHKILCRLLLGILP